jgi:hypothetical protein
MKGPEKVPREISLEVTNFTKNTARCNDSEPNPKTPHNTDENSDDFVTKELMMGRSRELVRHKTRRHNDGTGGKEMTKRMATGMSHPNLRL